MPGTAPAPAPIHVRDAGSDTEMSAAALSHLRWQPADVTWQKVNSSIQQQFGLCYISSLPGNTIRGQTLHSQCSTRSQVMPCNLNTPLCPVISAWPVQSPSVGPAARTLSELRAECCEDWRVVKHFPHANFFWLFNLWQGTNFLKLLVF